MKKKNFTLFFGLFFALAALAFVFQNCSNTALVRDLEGQAAFAKLSTEVCLNGELADYTIESSYVANLSYVFNQGKPVADSDSDGLSDNDEIKYGFDPLNRRSTSSILDSICLNLSGKNNCQSHIPVCSKTMTNLGLNDCDIKALNLDQLYGHPDMGLDSDKDGIPDFLEISRGLFPNIKDDNDDPDHDLRLNSRELSQGSDPLYANSSSEGVEIQATVSQVTTASQNGGSTNCTAGEAWRIEVPSIPLVPVAAFRDPDELVATPNQLTFSHAQDENVIVSFVKLKPKLGVMGKNSMIYFYKMNAKPGNFNFNAIFGSGQTGNYKKAGEVLP